MNTLRRTIPGFTIIELIVAIAVSSIMLFLISVLFSSASDAVSMGMATSDIIGNARALGDQIERDSNAMTGPGNGQNGFIVIVTKNLAGTPYHEPHLVEGVRNLRSDQLAFIVSYNGKPAQPVCAAASTTYNPPTKAQMAQATHARVWYGHVLKTDGDGLPANPPGAIGALGINRVANQLALGRQALFLLDRTYHPTTGVPDAALAINMSTGAWFDAVVQGTVGSGRPLYQGTTDVADWSYQNAKHPQGSMFGDDPTLVSPSSAFPNKTLWNFDNGVALSAAVYQARALSYTYATQSLWANSQPGSPAETDKSKWYPSDQISQMHPILADYLSDFIVDFAGDYVNNNLNPGNPDGVPDVDGSGEILWYGMGNPLPGGPPPWLAVESHQWPIQTSAGGGTAYVFRHDVPEQWPYLIRIRYRLHDRRGDLLGARSPEDELGGGVGTNVGKWFEQIIVIPR